MTYPIGIPGGQMLADQITTARAKLRKPSMPNLYLIAHKVRGEPAFDVALRMHCPECCSHLGEYVGCLECDHLGYWWIIPTSGHRAYPYWEHNLGTLDLASGEPEFNVWEPENMPPSLRDHYTVRADPSRPKLSDLFKPKPFTMNRRI